MRPKAAIIKKKYVLSAAEGRESTRGRRPRRASTPAKPASIYIKDKSCDSVQSKIAAKKYRISHISLNLRDLKSHDHSIWHVGPLTRSEERRVGQECRSRGSPYHLKKKKKKKKREL